MSIANDIAQAIASRLANISITNGYQTDLNHKVLRGRRRLNQPDLPCAVLIERDDKPSGQSGQRDPSAKIKQPYVIEGHAACDPDNPNDVGHQIIADLKRAIWSGGPLVYGAAQKVITVTYEGKSIAPREDGIVGVAAAIEISVEFVEQLANP